MLTPVDAYCKHGTLVTDYCPNCTFSGAPRDTIKVQVNAVLDLEVEKHWSLAELAMAVEAYLNRYVDTPGYAPSTYYLRAIHVDPDSFRKAQL